MPGPVLPPGSQNVPAPPSPTTVLNVLTNALYEINVVAPGETPDPLELAFVADKFWQIVDSWNTRKVYITAVQLISAAPGAAGAPFLLVPNLNPHTIGPAYAGSPTFPVAFERPVRIKNINILLNNVTPVVRQPLTRRDSDWWATQRVQAVTTELPTDFYYRPDQPLGSIFFWPLPDYAYGAEIEIETVLQASMAPALGYNQPFDAAPGYELAMTLTLAELLCPAFEKVPNQMLMGAAASARMAVQGLNAQPPRINLNDFGHSTVGRPRASFNYYTGLSTR